MTQNYRANRQIRVREVRVIGANAEQLGVMPTEQALELAAEAEMDLVEVAPNARPPVCRIMDYGKFKYDKNKKSKKKPHATKVKEIRLRPKTDKNDYEVKIKRARDFVEEGHRLIVTVLFRGREMAFRDRGRALLDKFVEDMADMARPEQAPRFEGRRFNLVLIPLKPGGPGKPKSERVPARKEEKPDVPAPSEGAAAQEPAGAAGDPGPKETDAAGADPGGGDAPQD